MSSFNFDFAMDNLNSNISYLMAQSLTQTPTGAVELHSHDVGAVTPSTVLVKFLAAPINPLDLLVLRGTYPVKPTHQYQGKAIPGYDGIGEVVECGEGVTQFIPGDLVVLSTGTWRTHAVLDVSSLQKISRPNDLAFGAMLKLDVLPAYFLLEDMAALKPGDWIVQNAATSVVAQMVTQFAHMRGRKRIARANSNPLDQSCEASSRFRLWLLCEISH